MNYLHYAQQLENRNHELWAVYVVYIVQMNIVLMCGSRTSRIHSCVFSFYHRQIKKSYKTVEIVWNRPLEQITNDTEY